VDGKDYHFEIKSCRIKLLVNTYEDDEGSTLTLATMALRKHARNIINDPHICHHSYFLHMTGDEIDFIVFTNASDVIDKMKEHGCTIHHSLDSDGCILATLDKHETIRHHTNV